MIFSLSEISTVSATFEEDVEAYAAAGFTAIGLWESKLPADDASNRDLLRSYGLEVSVCVPAIPSVLQLAIAGMEGPPDPGTRIEALAASVERLAGYRPECVGCLAGPLGGRPEEEATGLLVGALRTLAGVARSSGVHVGFEPVHATQRDSAGFVTSLAQTNAILEAVAAPEVGVLFDTYHLWDDPDVFTWIEAHAPHVVGVHVSDWPAGERMDRVLPGEGISRTHELVRALVAAGWDGALDVEIFSTPELFWGLGTDEAAERAYAALVGLTATL